MKNPLKPHPTWEKPLAEIEFVWNLMQDTIKDFANVTLIIRDLHDKEQDICITRDDLDKVEAAFKRLRKQRGI